VLDTLQINCCQNSSHDSFMRAKHSLDKGGLGNREGFLPSYQHGTGKVRLSNLSDLVTSLFCFLKETASPIFPQRNPSFINK